MFHNLAVPVLHLFIWIVKFLSLYVDELNDDDDDNNDDVNWYLLNASPDWAAFVNARRIVRQVEHAIYLLTSLQQRQPQQLQLQL